MNSVLVTALSVVTVAGAAFAQPGYTFEMRIIGDGDAGSPGGPTPASTYAGDPWLTGATRIGFWLQARVSQTVNQNWGIVRASSPVGAPSFITITDSVAGGTSFQRGITNGAGNHHGRGYGYRSFGADNGSTANGAGSANYPGIRANENGHLDGGADGIGRDRIFAFDCFIGPRNDLDLDGDGIYHSPFGVNGQDNPNPNSDPVPVPMGTFSPWANLYRFYVDWSNFSDRRVTINASALLNGAVQTYPMVPGSSNFVMQVRATGAPTVTASYSFIPSPAVTVPLVAGLAFGGRRRR